MTKGAACPDRRPSTGRSPGPGTPEGWDLSPWPPGRADTAASDPTSREVQLLRTTKQNKGVRRGRSRRAFQSPLPPEPARGCSPRSPLAADQGLGSPRSLVSPRPPVTGAGEAAEGQRGMGKPDGSIPPPSCSIPPSGCPRPGRPPQGLGEASGPARPGSPQGKGCLCLKVTTRARCPGWAWCLPVLGRGGGDGGPPQISEVTGVRLTSLLPPPPVTAPSGNNQLAGAGVNSFHCWGVGDQVNSFHCFGAVGRRRPSGFLPHPSLPSMPEAPFLSGTPGGI